MHGSHAVVDESVDAYALCSIQSRTQCRAWARSTTVHGAHPNSTQILRTKKARLAVPPRGLPRELAHGPLLLRFFQPPYAKAEVLRPERLDEAPSIILVQLLHALDNTLGSHVRLDGAELIVLLLERLRHRGLHKACMGRNGRTRKQGQKHKAQGRDQKQ